ncbi:MAG: lipid-A-disaccharide synthase [Parachlamydiaceae bacterium]
MTHYFIFAGEPSGDLHGSRLIRTLNEQLNNASIHGVGGPRMRQEKFQCVLDMEEFQVMGFSDVCLALPRLYTLFYHIRNVILKTQPDCIILIDYPGFNLRLAQSLRKKKYTGKIVQYICPTVWAHGKKRIEVLADNYDLLLTIFPFEIDYFKNSPLKVEYIGNPLTETIHTHDYQRDWISKMGLPPDRDLIALFPGSRLGEIERHLGLQLKIASQLKQRHPHLHFVLPYAQQSLHEPILNMIRKGELQLNRDIHVISSHDHYDLMNHCKTALAKSGTVTLELALHNIPTVVIYELSHLNYVFAKYILKLNLPHYCIVNILSNQRIFPEFIGKKLSKEKIREAIEEILIDPIHYQKIQRTCEGLKEELGCDSPHKNAANAIKELMTC